MHSRAFTSRLFRATVVAGGLDMGARTGRQTLLLDPLWRRPSLKDRRSSGALRERIIRLLNRHPVLSSFRFPSRVIACALTSLYAFTHTFYTHYLLPIVPTTSACLSSITLLADSRHANIAYLVFDFTCFIHMPLLTPPPPTSAVCLSRGYMFLSHNSGTRYRATNNILVYTTPTRLADRRQRT